MVQNLERIFVLDAIDSADVLPKSQLGHPLQLHLVLFDGGPQGDLPLVVSPHVCPLKDILSSSKAKFRSSF
jgi:hypothetical protein